MASEIHSSITKSSNVLLSPFSPSIGATTLITENMSCSVGYGDTTIFKSRSDISTANFDLQSELEAYLKAIIVSIVDANVTTPSNITVGYVSTQYPQDLGESGGIYFLTSDVIPVVVNKCTGYTTYLDVIDCIVESIATLVINNGFTNSTIIFQYGSGDIVTTDTLSGTGTPQIFSIDLSVTSGNLSTYGGVFIHELFCGACINQEGIIVPSVTQNALSQISTNICIALKYLRYIFETTNRFEYKQSLYTSKIMDELNGGDESATIPDPPPDGSHGWNLSIPLSLDDCE
jgi:hypothetical protein